jgi:delta-1-pyrroline-5-carboxylate synthetase
LARLRLSPKKLAVLVEGVRSIANDRNDPIGRVLRSTELAPNLILKQQTVPLGVLLIIFESRPDAVVQIASLAICSGNGLLLKGGKEAMHSNRILHKVIVDAIAEFDPNLPREIIGLIETREEITELLALDDLIDLVIPRGSSDLVTFIQRNTRIPVLGHSEGICHVYVDKSADLNKAIPIVIDSKTDYPAACNAMETLLVHSSLIDQGLRQLVQELQRVGVTVNVGPQLALRMQELLPGDALKNLTLAPTLKHEYSDMQCTVEIVASIQDAIDHVHKYPLFGGVHNQFIGCWSLATSPLTTRHGDHIRDIM